MRTYNILLVSHDCEYGSGSFLCLVSLASQLQKLGNKVLVCIPYLGKAKDLLESNNIRYVVIKSNNWVYYHSIEKVKFFLKELLLQNRIALKKYLSLLKKEKIDIVHINNICSYIGALAAYKLGIPVVWHIREFLKDNELRFVFPKWYVFNVINNANEIILISKSVQNAYADMITSSRQIVIYDGLDNDYYFCNRTSLFSGKNIELLSVGSINEHKGQASLVKMLCKYLDSYPNVKLRLTLVGGGDNSTIAEITNIIKRHQKKFVTFVGPQNDPRPYYQKADIFCMPSQKEGFGRVTIEAMLSGCLVLGRNTGATPEIITQGKTGFLYQDQVSFDNQLNFIVNNKRDAQNIARVGQKEALKRFSTKKNANQVNDIYNQLMKKAK